MADVPGFLLTWFWFRFILLLLIRHGAQCDLSCLLLEGTYETPAYTCLPLIERSACP